MTTVGSKVPFFNLCVLLDKISSKSGTDVKKKLLREFIDEWRIFHAKIHQNDKNVTDSFYPAMRLLLPQLEREREAYGIKEHTMAKYFIDLLGLGKNSPAAGKLLNYRNPKNAKGDAGDFATVAYFILKDRCPDRGNMTIAEVNECLDKVARSNAARDKEGIKKNIMKMLRGQSARELRWLTRMVLKELKIGISQQSVLSVFHQDAEDLYNVKMSLEKVCAMLHDPNARLHEIEIAVFSPFRPMLGDRGAPQKMEKTMENKPFFIETKFDGERMQLHKKGDEYKFFSRGGHEYTATYGATPFDGNLTPFINNCFKDGVDSCILDGEMVGYNPETKTLGSKGEGFDIKSKDIADYQPMLCVFDILALNDKVLSNKTLKERKTILHKDVITPKEGRFVLSEYKEASTNSECISALNEAIDNREEGIMVKDPSSPYKPNTRKGGWFKIKPEYVGGLMDELDLIVVGGYMGEGKRAGLMSHFLCALAVTPDNSDEKPTVFHSFCKVGSGYTRKELLGVNVKLGDHWEAYKKSKPPAWLILASGGKQRPDACIHPSKSIVLQIKAAEITDSDQYKTGCTLRFPRVEKIRHDKNWFDCMTTSELDELRQKSSGKLAGRKMDVEGGDDDEPAKKRRKGVVRAVRPTVMSQFKGIDASKVTKVSEMLQGKEICVINGPSSHSKADMEKSIIECGGTIVQNPGADTFCVLAQKVTVKVRNIISKGVHDVVQADWLVRCVDTSTLLPWVPGDMLHTSKSTQDKFDLQYDDLGDSYFDNTSVEELKRVFCNVEKKSCAEKLTNMDIGDLENKYFPDESLYGLFRTTRVYLDNNLVLGESSTHIATSSLDLTVLDLRFHGAQITPNLDDNVSHVVVSNSDLTRIQSLREVNRQRMRKFHIIGEDWVHDSIERGVLAGERSYEPPPS